MDERKDRSSGSVRIRRTLFDEDDTWGGFAPDVVPDEQPDEESRQPDDALACAEELVAREERMLLFRGGSDEEDGDPTERTEDRD